VVRADEAARADVAVRADEAVVCDNNDAAHDHNCDNCGHDNAHSGAHENDHDNDAVAAVVAPAVWAVKMQMPHTTAYRLKLIISS